MLWNFPFLQYLAGMRATAGGVAEKFLQFIPRLPDHDPLLCPPEMRTQTPHPIHLILSAGTRIVTRNETNRIGGGQLIATGSVAVIISSPDDAKHAYKVRFNDGAEAMLRRNEFSILKEFKNVPDRGCVADQPQRVGKFEAAAADATTPHTAALHASNLTNAPHSLSSSEEERAGERSSSSASNADFDDWKPFIIYRCVVGSQAFGLSGDDSDVDRRGIYLPPAELHWSLYGVPEQIENNDTQEAYWELQKFLVMALKANPNILECLHTPLVEFATPLAEELLAGRKHFLSKLIYQTYNGYVMSQFKKLEQDLRAHGDIKWKHAMHLMRLLLSGINALREGELRVRLDEHRDALLQIKRGDLPWPEVNAWRLCLHKEFDEAFASTKLPERPDYNWANDFLLKARNEMAQRKEFV